MRSTMWRSAFALASLTLLAAGGAAAQTTYPNVKFGGMLQTQFYSYNNLDNAAYLALPAAAVISFKASTPRSSYTTPAAINTTPSAIGQYRFIKENSRYNNSRMASVCFHRNGASAAGVRPQRTSTMSCSGTTCMR